MGLLVVMRRTVNVLQASHLVGVSRRTIYNWLRWGWLEYERGPRTADGTRIYVDSLWRDMYPSTVVRSQKKRRRAA